MIELFKTLEGITQNYLSELFVNADTPFDTRDLCKLSPSKGRLHMADAPLDYGARVWDILLTNKKANS